MAICNEDYDAYLTRVLLFDRKLGDFEGLLDFGDFWELEMGIRTPWQAFESKGGDLSLEG